MACMGFVKDIAECGCVRQYKIYLIYLGMFIINEALPTMNKPKTIKE
jgi:hypothetical protein